MSKTQLWILAANLRLIICCQKQITNNKREIWRQNSKLCFGHGENWIYLKYVPFICHHFSLHLWKVWTWSKVRLGEPKSECFQHHVFWCQLFDHKYLCAKTTLGVRFLDHSNKITKNRYSKLSNVQASRFLTKECNSLVIISPWLPPEGSFVLPNACTFAKCGRIPPT